MRNETRISHNDKPHPWGKQQPYIFVFTCIVDSVLKKKEQLLVTTSSPDRYVSYARRRYVMQFTGKEGGNLEARERERYRLIVSLFLFPSGSRVIRYDMHLAVASHTYPGIRIWWGKGRGGEQLHCGSLGFQKSMVNVWVTSKPSGSPQKPVRKESMLLGKLHAKHPPPVRGCARPGSSFVEHSRYPPSSDK